MCARCDERQKAEPFQQDIEDDDGVSQASVDPLDNSKLGPPYGIVLNGHSLVSLHTHTTTHTH